jgi:hypothetical protein
MGRDVDEAALVEEEAEGVVVDGEGVGEGKRSIPPYSESSSLAQYKLVMITDGTFRDVRRTQALAKLRVGDKEDTGKGRLGKNLPVEHVSQCALGTRMMRTWPRSTHRTASMSSSQRRLSPE